MTVTVLSLIILLTLWALTTQLRAWMQPGGTR